MGWCLTLAPVSPSWLVTRSRRNALQQTHRFGPSHIHERVALGTNLAPHARCGCATPERPAGRLQQVTGLGELALRTHFKHLSLQTLHLRSMLLIDLFAVTRSINTKLQGVNMNARLNLTLTSIAVVLVGCATNTGVVPMGRDTYRIANTSATAFASGGEMLASLYRQADQHCRSMKKELMPINESSRNGAPYQGATGELQYRCLASNDSELRRPTMEDAPNVRVQVK